MRQNYFYKCTDCQTMKSIEDNLGVSTWALLCRPCGQVVTEHYRLDIMHRVTFSNKEFHHGNWYIGCPKEKEDNDTNTGTDKEKQVDVNRPVD